MVPQLPAPSVPIPLLQEPAPPLALSSQSSRVVDSQREEWRHLADVPLRIEAVLDCVVMNIRAVADLRPGSLLVLSRPAGDSVQIHVGSVPIASGEVVVIENTVCVRITDLSPGS